MQKTAYNDKIIMGELMSPRSTLSRRDALLGLAGLGLSFVAADQLDVDAKKRRRKHKHKKNRNNTTPGPGDGGGGQDNGGGGIEDPMAQVIRNGDRGRALVFPTFDDGFDPVQAERVAQMAGDAGIILGFFPVAKAIEESPALWKDIYNNHHIDLHTYGHTPITTMTPQQIEEDTKRSIDIIGNTVQDPQYEAVFFRPPLGDGFFGTNEGNKSTAADLQRIMGKMGMAIALWDVYTLDTEPNNKGTDPETQGRMLARVRDTAQNGSIILQHTNENDVNIFPEMLVIFQEKGLTPGNIRQQVW